MQHCEQKEIVSFKPIESDAIEIDLEILSKDQKYLLLMYRAVSSGSVHQNLSSMSPGTMHHARWLTTANRILRLYVSTSEPSSNLLVLVEYIMKVYVPVWFSIKCHSSAKDGPKHFFQLVSKSRCLPGKYRTVVNKVLQHNSYFAHAENILLAMLHDDSSIIRELSVRRILKAREKKVTRARKFQLPKINFEATTYYSMINWQECQLEEPPITKKFSNQCLVETIIEKKEILKLPDFLNHTQAVERTVKMVTESSKTVTGNVNRDGMIRAKHSGRKLLPKFDTKKEFNINT